MTTVPLSQSDLLALLKRISDETWLSGILSTPDGQAIVAAWTAVWEAASIAVSKQVDCSMISTAPAGAFGVCTLVLSRADATAAGSIPQGYTFISNLGVSLIVATPITIASGQATVALPLVTLRQTDLVNTVENAFDDILDPGDFVDAILGTANPACPFFDAPHSAGTLVYASSTPIVGAIEDWLSAHGEERGCKRQAGEDGESYRARVRLIPDAVSPKAVAAALDGASPLLPERWMVEPFDDGADPVVRLALQLGRFDMPACDGSFCDDWTGEPLADKLPLNTCETVGLRESRAYVRVDLVGDLEEPDGSVLYCDAGYCDDDRWGYPDVGTNPAISSAAQALQQELRNKLAGGVQSDIYLDDSTYLRASKLICSPLLFWTVHQDGTIYCSLSSGGSPFVFQTGQNGPSGISTDGDNVYWACDGDGTIMTCPVAGGTPTVLASGQPSPYHVSSDGDNVYWACDGDGTIRTCPVTGGTPTVFASGQATPRGVCSDGINVYWTKNSDGTIMVCPCGGGTPAVFASGQGYPNGVSSDGTNVYWAASTTGGPIMVRPVTGGTPSVFATGQDGTQGVSSDGTYVYWCSWPLGEILRQGVGETSPTVIAVGQNGPWGVSSLFFGDLTAGARAWSMAASPGSAWYIQEGLISCAPFDATTQALRVVITLADSTQLDSGWIVAGTIPLRTFELAKMGYRGQRVVRIDGWLRSSVVLGYFNIAGNFQVIQATL